MVARRVSSLTYLAALAGCAIMATAAHAAVDVLPIDLDPLIDVAAQSPTRFAVDIPHRISVVRDGAWANARGIATWHYTVRIPSAVSLSFHANVSLPADASLMVRGLHGMYVYRSSDVRNSELWSRISSGDSMEFVLSVPGSERHATKFEILSLQAGYRGLGHHANNPHYDKLLRLRAQAGLPSCVQNYACYQTASNSPAAGATVAITIANVGQCTATLLNDVPGDGIPYVLTARHCETGTYGASDPAAASAINVYWDAISPCAGVLDTIYDSTGPVTAGASTIVEQQDAWLMTLDASPPVADAYYAGFDASGGAILGGYTIDHALSYDKQFTTWYGQAYPVEETHILSSTFVSDFWEVVNRTGTIGPGASGSGLFDQNNHLVGSLSLGRTTGEGDTYQSCPMSPPVAPNGSNGAADFTSFAAVWNSTADGTSSTGSTTLKSVLDPGNTGTLVVGAMATSAPVSFSATTPTGTINMADLLTWNAAGATQCVAGGGTGGDGWVTGTVAASGSVNVKEQTVGAVKYTLTCSAPGNRNVSGFVTVNWIAAPTVVTFNLSDHSVWVGAPNRLSWSSNISGTCTLSGGSTNLADLPATGSATVTESTAGGVHYTLTCGSGANSVTTSRDDQYVVPSVEFVESNSDLLFGETYMLEWTSLADSCTPTGGTIGDNWSGTQLRGNGTFFPIIPAVGTYTYGVICTAGSVSASATATVTVENNPPYANLTVSAATVVTGQPVTVTWKSNLFFCAFTGNPIGAGDTVLQTASSGSIADGSATYVPKYADTWTFGLSCGDGVPGRTATASNVTLTSAAALDSSVSAAPTSVTVGQQFTLTWLANFASSCTASGGGADGIMWTGSPALPGGQNQITASVAGTFTYTLACVGAVSTDTQTTHATVTVMAAMPTGTGGNGSGSSGGGGSVDDVSLLALALLAVLRTRAITTDRRT